MLDSGTSGDTGDDGGWAFVADSDGAAELLATLVELDDDTYTRSKLSERSGVPLKTLYFDDLIGELVDLDVPSRAGSPSAWRPIRARRRGGRNPRKPGGNPQKGPLWGRGTATAACDCSDETIIMTGASAGIGREVAPLPVGIHPAKTRVKQAVSRSSAAMW